MGFLLCKRDVLVVGLVAVLTLSSCSTSSTKEIAAGCAATDRREPVQTLDQK